MVVRGRPLRIRERGRFCYLCDIYLSGDLCWTHGRLHGLDYGRWRGLGGTLIRSGTNGNSIRCSVRCRRRFRLVFIRFAHFLFIQESYCKTKQKENNKTKKKKTQIIDEFRQQNGWLPNRIQQRTRGSQGSAYSHRAKDGVKEKRMNKGKIGKVERERRKHKGRGEGRLNHHSRRRRPPEWRLAFSNSSGPIREEKGWGLTLQTDGAEKKEKNRKKSIEKRSENKIYREKGQWQAMGRSFFSYLFFHSSRICLPTSSFTPTRTDFFMNAYKKRFFFPLPFFLHIARTAATLCHPLEIFIQRRITRDKR